MLTLEQQQNIVNIAVLSLGSLEKASIVSNIPTFYLNGILEGFEIKIEYENKLIWLYNKCC